MINRYLSSENLEWREFIKFGLPALSIVGIIFSAFHGFAAKQPALLVLQLILTLVGMFIEGRKSIATVAVVKLASIALVLIGITIITGKPMFAVIGILACVFTFILVLRKT